MKKRYISVKTETWVIVALLIILTLPFLFSELDLIIQQKYYSADQGWFLAKSFPWRQLRDYSFIPAILISAGALNLYVLGLNFRKYEKYRKICLYLITVMILAPGLLINVVLKGNFGRPRPRDIVEFDGKYQYEKPLLYDSSSPGKSFPCGHASMGFYFFVFYILYRRRNKGIAIAGFTFAVLFGGLIGTARIIQGGHFLSDSIWSAALVYLSALWLYQLFNFDRELYSHPNHTMDTAGKRTRITIASIVMVLLILAVSIATPVDKTHTVKLKQEQLQKAESINIELELYRADLEIIEGDFLFIFWKYHGFGPPKARLKSYEDQNMKNGNYNISIKQYHTGFFTEFQQTLQIVIPDNKKTHLRYKNGDEIYEKTYN